jgi:hypothetical protein
MIFVILSGLPRNRLVTRLLSKHWNTRFNFNFCKFIAKDWAEFRYNSLSYLRPSVSWNHLTHNKSCCALQGPSIHVKFYLLINCSHNLFLKELISMFTNLSYFQLKVFLTQNRRKIQRRRRIRNNWNHYRQVCSIQKYPAAWFA